jgi:predicted ribosomally synthesized peptide with SipW-like signal peptide
MKKIKHVLIVAVALILTCAISVAATYAYLYDKSDTARNTISAGKVKVSLSEARVNEDGKPVDENGNEVALADAPRVLNNHYKLLPNRTYTKDPTIYVEEGSEDCILFVLMYIPDALDSVIDYSSNGELNLGKQITQNGWGSVNNLLKEDADGNRIGVYKWWVFTDGSSIPCSVSGGTTVPLFESITVKSDASYAALEKASATEMEITAFAFQWEELADEDSSYNYIINSLNEAYDLYGN